MRLHAASLRTLAAFTVSYCSGAAFVEPAVEYHHALGRCAVVGGVVLADGGPLDGRYLYADYCTGEIWGLRFSEGLWLSDLLVDHGSSITSFGRNANGRAFVVDGAG